MIRHTFGDSMCLLFFAADMFRGKKAPFHSDPAIKIARYSLTVDPAEKMKFV